MNCHGTIERITFHNKENGFCVLRIQEEGKPTLTTLTGKSLDILVGASMKATGRWVTHKQHGEQFEADTITLVQPTSLEGIEKYLGSGLIKGIGPSTAKLLIQHFGKDILNILDSDPNALLKVPGIGPKFLKKVKASWAEQKALSDVMIFLQQHGIGTHRAIRIYKFYRSSTIHIIEKNPYRLVNDIPSIGFKIADRLAHSLGIDPHSPLRANAGIIYVLQKITANGHCYTTHQELLAQTETLLQLPTEVVEPAINAQIQRGRLIQDDDAIYLESFYHTELNIADHLARLRNPDTPPWQGVDIKKAIGAIQAQHHFQLSQSQADAIALALAHKVVCITGGPGVGKTTIINSLLQIVRKERAHVTLCAPTGRAAKRLSESTGLEASTIHRLLELNPATHEFAKNEDEPLKTDCLVVDEASMLDIHIMQALLSALPSHAALIVVGDVDQLPSVGPGRVLGDLIDSGKIPTAYLTEIFRQAKGSRIVTNAHKINQGEIPSTPVKGEASDFYIIPAATPAETYKKLLYVIQERLPKAFQLSSTRDIQILTPMNRGELGTHVLNERLQAALNPNPLKSVTAFNRQLSLNDKVIQTVNNYEKEVFNGDIGFIRKIKDEEVTIQFDEREVIYALNELDEVSLAYAMSIHKSQGSEYPAVIIPLSTQHYIMLQRNLLYTAVTRGKQLVILIGSPKAIALAVSNEQQEARKTKLATRIF